MSEPHYDSGHNYLAEFYKRLERWDECLILLKPVGRAGLNCLQETSNYC
jgi:hypothetical protein